MSGSPPHKSHPIVDEPPPIGRTWSSIYVFVLVYLAILIFTFYIFTRVFDS